MLSDEMTTGSVTTSDTDKRVYASRSHGWNLQQRRFREAFPEVSTMCSVYASGVVLRPCALCPKRLTAYRWTLAISDLIFQLWESLLLIGLVHFQYCTSSRRTLPNMGEKERGLPDKLSSETSSMVTVTPAAARPLPTPKTTLVVQPPVLVPKAVGAIRPRKGRAVSTTGAGDGSRGWATNWREVVWEKWRWGVLIALAVIVSRITTSA